MMYTECEQWRSCTSIITAYRVYTCEAAHALSAAHAANTQEVHVYASLSPRDHSSEMSTLSYYK